MSERTPLLDNSPGALSENDIWWRDHQPWLLQCGYQLRARYRPGWIPSWTNTRRLLILCEDAQRAPRYSLNDGVAVSDGRRVIFKRVIRADHPEEVDISQYFNTPQALSDPKNHCVPIIEVLAVPDASEDILVLPLLRLWYDPVFETVGEVVHCLQEIFEGVQYMHNQQIAHRDCTGENIMMDASSMYPQNDFHPWDTDWNWSYTTLLSRVGSRTINPPRYHLIDFGLSVRYDPDDPSPLVLPAHGGDQSMPEFQGDGYNRMQNPFPSDIYYLGNMIRVYLLDGHPGRMKVEHGYQGLDLLRPLAAEMTHDDPAERPSINEVVERFATLRSSLTPWQLRARVVSKHPQNGRTHWFNDILHWIWTIGLVIRGIPPIPNSPLSTV